MVSEWIVNTLYRVAFDKPVATMEVALVMVFRGIHCWKTNFSARGFTRLVTMVEALQVSTSLHGGKNRVPASSAPGLAGRW